MSLHLNDVFKVVNPELSFQGLHRVLWIQHDEDQEIDLALTIEIPVRQAGGPLPRYFRGPVRRSFAALRRSLVQGDIVVTSLALPPLVSMTDAEIRHRYPQRSGLTKRRIRNDCALLQARDRDWALIEPLVSFIQNHSADAFETDVLHGMKRDIVKTSHVAKSDVNDALHRWLALCCGRNSLLPGTYLSGAKGKSRRPKRCSKLGRPNAAWVAGKTQSRGIHLNEERKVWIQMGWKRSLSQGLNVDQAYVLTMGAWWSCGTRLVNGQAVPELLPTDERPTRRQFSYWGPKGDGGQSAFRLLLGGKKWEQRYRPKTGSSLDGVNAIGQVGLMDATSTDVNLVATHSILKAIGTCHRIFLHDGSSDVICGLYCGLEAPSAQTALLTVFNAASDKSAFCRRFGIEVKPDEFPSVQFFKILTDNGELRNERSMSVLAALSIAMEYVEGNRPERKGMVETGHKSMHRLIDHRIAGTTHGRPHERGEDHSAIGACWTWFDYMTELIRAIVHFNSEADASELMARHPFRTEMARDQVPATRSAIHAWCVKNNRIAMPSVNVELLRAHLLPITRAVVKQTGVYLLRPDRGQKVEFIRGHRFTGPRATELGWHQGTSASVEIEVRHNPNDLSAIWYADEMGLHRLDNQSRDHFLLEQGTLADSLALQDDEALNGLLRTNEQDQSLSDIVSIREDKNLRRKKQKADVIAKSPVKVTKKLLKSGVEQNRKDEAAFLAELLDPVSRTPREQDAPEAAGNQSEIRPAEPISQTRNEDSTVSTALSTFRARRRPA